MKYLKSIFVLLICVLLTNCVSTKTYKEIESRYAFLKIEYNELEEKYNGLEENNQSLKNTIETLNSEKQDIRDSVQRKQLELNAVKNNLKNLQESYNALERNSNNALKESIEKNRGLLDELEAKENLLAQEAANLESIKQELENKISRIEELENLIAEKENAMNSLKETISNALLNFQGKGLTVELRNGKVYVSLENKLLFNSGSWTVGTQGVEAITKLAAVLADNDDIDILIEGHTDNVPYNGNNFLKNNWDLSTKRATAIVELFEKNTDIDLRKLTAAGKGEHSPITSNDTPEGRAKNRRIEIVLSPNLDKITDLLNTIK